MGEAKRRKDRGEYPAPGEWHVSSHRHIPAGCELPPDVRRIFYLEDSEPLTAELRGRLLRDGWPVGVLDEAESLGALYSRGRGSLLFPDAPGLECVREDGEMLVHVHQLVPTPREAGRCAGAIH